MFLKVLLAIWMFFTIFSVLNMYLALQKVAEDIKNNRENQEREKCEKKKLSVCIVSMISALMFCMIPIFNIFLPFYFIRVSDKGLEDRES